MQVTVYRYLPHRRGAERIHLVPLRIPASGLTGFTPLHLPPRPGGPPLFELCEWLSKNTTSVWYVDLFGVLPGVERGSILFHQKSDAAMFKLFWF